MKEFVLAKNKGQHSVPFFPSPWLPQHPAQNVPLQRTLAASRDQHLVVGDHSVALRKEGITACGQLSLLEDFRVFYYLGFSVCPKKKHLKFFRDLANIKPVVLYCQLYIIL